jgi:hypothetical protein
VPQLVAGKGGYESRPRVETLVDHIACELRVATDRNRLLVEDKYVITINLLLQVDDAFGTTPNATYTEGLKPPDTSLVTQLGLGLNGDRLRTFTTTYVVKATELAASPRPETCPVDRTFTETRYRLDGNLRLGEIIDSGLAARARGGGIITIPEKDGDKAAPTFGSQVQFIVTESLTALGPTWTLRYFKGPSGANGLFNGKRVYKNSVIVTFAPARTPAGKRADTLAAKDALAAAQRQLAEAQDNLAQLASPSLLPGEKMTPQLQRQLALNQLLVEQVLSARRAEVARASAELAAAEAQKRLNDEGARDAAVAASRDLLTTMLLQNLPPR